MAETEPEVSSRRRTFRPVVALGLLSTGLAVLATSNDLVRGRAGTVTHETLATSGRDLTGSPLASALALTVLATWGVVLVTRGWFRRLVTAIGLAGSLGLAVALVVQPRQMLDRLSDALLEASPTETASVELTIWAAVAMVTCLGMVVASGAALVLVKHWPEMGSRYDAPGQQRSEEPVEPENNLDIWKALDDGRDPTA